VTRPPRSTAVVASSRASLAGREVTLLDLLDRLLQGGIVIQGDITLAVADIDLVDLSLRLVVGSTGSLGRAPERAGIIEGTLA
jgi:hypothetical protein